MLPTDPADLFATLYDQLPERLFAEYEEAEEWLHDDAVNEIASLVEEEVVLDGRLSTESLERFAVEVDQVERNGFAVLLGLDRAMFQLDPTAGTYDDAGLVDLTARYFETGRLNTDEVEGAVLPRIVNPAQQHLLPESLSDAFQAVIRVRPEMSVPVRQVILDAWPSRTLRDSGLFVSCLPAFGREDPLLVERIQSPEPAYRLCLEPPADEDQWVSARLAALDESNATLALLPEMALTPSLLKAWQRVIRATPRPTGTRLQWLVLGTGPEHEGRSVRPHNRAVVVDRATATVIWEQDKLFRFQLEPEMIARWGLADRLAPGPVEEWITTGTELVVVEGPGIRLAILICEDLTELDTTGVTAVAWGVSHALVPVFSQAIRRYRWEEGSAGQLLQQGGVRTVVCNSQWVGDVEPDSDMVCGDALAIGTERHLADAETPTTAVTFRFTSEGVFLLRDPSLT